MVLQTAGAREPFHYLYLVTRYAEGFMYFREDIMTQANVVMKVRQVDPTASIIDIQGDLSAAAETLLMDAYTEASGPTTRFVLLNFVGLAYMNSSGIGLLVTLLIRMNRKKQQLICYGLSEHYKHIFELTRLSDVIKVYDAEAGALATLKD